MVFFTITSDSNEPNPTEIWVPVKTNAEFEKRLQLLRQELQTNSENLERQEQRLVAELDRFNLVKKETLRMVQSFPDDSDVKGSILQALDDLETRLQRSQEELQKLRENQRQVVKKAELAKEIGDSLLKQIEQRDSSKETKLTKKIGDWLSRLSRIRKKNST